MCEFCGQEKNDSWTAGRPEPAVVVRAAPMTERDRLFEFAFKNHDLGHLPGQFVEISLPGIGETLISIASSPTKKGGFEMVIRKVGRVTTALHELGAGALIGIRGPFGSHFALEEFRGKDLLFVAGGIGLVPLRSAINFALDNRADYGKIIILFGCTDPSQRLFTDEIARWKTDASVVVVESVDRADPSWTGATGLITTLFPKVKSLLDPTTTKALVVGPPDMYKFVLLELKKLGFSDADILLSLERNVRCGLRKCDRCHVGTVYECRQGPVFSYESVIANGEAL